MTCVMEYSVMASKHLHIIKSVHVPVLFLHTYQSLFVFKAMSAHSSLQENKVLLTKAFQASPT